MTRHPRMILTAPEAVVSDNHRPRPVWPALTAVSATKALFIRLRDYWVARKSNRQLQQAAARLAELSSHLLDDAGLSECTSYDHDLLCDVHTDLGEQNLETATGALNLGGRM